ncbi:hypothetical protein AB0I50_46320, partial [Streptomyces prunicolor]
MTTLDAPEPVRRRPPAPRYRRAVLAAGVAAALLGTLGNAPAPRAQAERPAVTACPPNLLGKAACYTGQDTNGAYYAMAVPTHWNGSLVVHAHGGPDLGDTSDPARSTDDLNRWAVMVDEGYGILPRRHRPPARRVLRGAVEAQGAAGGGPTNRPAASCARRACPRTRS